MAAYIKASGVISPQPTHGVTGFPVDIRELKTDRLSCIEPDYRSLINPLQLRRLPRILKMGLAASQLCINRSGGVKPDGIIIGTGLGCLDNLEKFLLEVLNNNEQVTSVLPFINSTHNAVAAQVAMLLKNHNYNLTYCHRGFSFESALQDALMLVSEQPAYQVLVGGIDECTDDFIKLHHYLGDWKEPVYNLNLLSEKSPGTLAGEGAAFFMLAGNAGHESHTVSVAGVHTFLTPPGPDMAAIENEISWFLNSMNISGNTLDAVMLGVNGDSRHEMVYQNLITDFFTPDTNILCFKHLCGEYYTASAFALWLGSVILTDQAIPDIVSLKKGNGKALNNLLIYNHINGKEHALILLNYGQF